MKFMPFNFKSN